MYSDPSYETGDASGFPAKYAFKLARINVVAAVPAVLGCHQIRTRGSADHVFMDLHVWLDGRTSLDSAHATSHIVKDLLMRRFPHVADVIIHIEPPPDQLPIHRPAES